MPALPSYEDLFGGGSQSNPAFGPTQGNPYAVGGALDATRMPLNARKAGGKGKNNRYGLGVSNPNAGGGAAGGGYVPPGGFAAGGAGARAGAGAARGGVAAAPGATGTSNTAQISPYLLSQIGRYEDRLSADTTKRAIDNSNLGIADSAALMAADAKGRMAGRGILNSGAGDAFVNKRITQPAQRQAAGAAADIALGRERDLDNLVLGGTGLMTAPDAIALDSQRLALAQQGQATDQAFRTQQAQQQAQQQQMQMLMSLYGSMLGRYPGGF